MAKIHGRHYRFFRDEQKKLIVHEVDGDVVLELLNHQDIQKWGEHIPIRLQNMFSHWCCRNTRTEKVETILFRDRNFSDRDVHFFLHHKDDRWICARVPEHQRKRNWHKELLLRIEKFDHLILLKDLTCPIINILNKFEPRMDCVHVFKVCHVYA